MNAHATSALDPAVLALLRCPTSGRPLHAENREGVAVLATDNGGVVYQIRDGIPILLPPPHTQKESPQWPKAST